MGWKSFKEHFQIEHNVQVRDGFILIGSDYVSDLAKVNIMTGEVIRNENFTTFLPKYYPHLLDIPAIDILAVLAQKDYFLRDIPVYTYENGGIIKRYCEEFKYPNVTHEGYMMYSNKYSTSRDVVHKWAVEREKRDIEHYEERLREISEKEAEIKKRISASIMALQRLSGQ